MNVKSLQKELKELKIKSRNYVDTMFEGEEGYNPFDDKIEMVSEKLSYAEELEEREDWTEDVTKERREIWNSLARSGNVKNVRDCVAQEKKLGWRMDTLKKFIKIYETKSEKGQDERND